MAMLSTKLFSGGCIKSLLLRPQCHACNISNAIISRVFSSGDRNDIPSPPKKPQSSFIRFSMEKRPTVVAENPGLSTVDYIKIIGNLWRELPAEEKQVYTQQWDEHKVIYQKQYAEYLEGLSDEQKEEIATLDKLKRKKRKQLKTKKMLKNLGKPKKPKQAYIYYIMSLRSGKQFQPGQFGETMQELSEKWKNLSEEEKLVYIRQAQEDLFRYEQEMTIWEDRMLEEGRPDLVRGYKDPKKSKSSKRKSKKNPQRDLHDAEE